MTLRGAWIQIGQCVQVSKGELASSIETLDVGPANNLMKFNFMHQHVSFFLHRYVVILICQVWNACELWVRHDHPLISSHHFLVI